MTFEFHAKTDPGRTRANNEDAVAFDEALQVALLADGMGGYNAGEVASSMAIASVLEQIGHACAPAEPAPDPARRRFALEQSIVAASDSIYAAACADRDYMGMGTTLVVALFQPPGVVVGHVGDSRCYRLRDGVLERLTRDHSLLQEQLDAGLITPQQAALSDMRNLVTRALGVELSVLPEIHEHAVQPGDLYLLCSDGLNDMVDEDRIAAILGEPGASLARKADTLIDAANANGGRDNVSVLLAQHVLGGAAPGRQPQQRGLMARLLGT